MACNFPTDQVVVVGGGLAGVSACNTVVENGGRTVLIDKSSFCGGNSTKATSGINGSATRTQKEKGIEDSAELFTKDTLKGGAKRPEIAKVLCENSGRDVEWLMDVFNLDLSLVARLGGHSAPRTHRGKERFPGMTITYALIQMVEKVSETTDKARIITKARATKLLQNPTGDVVGLIYEKGGLQFQEHGPVILCSGGFGADFSNDSLLAKYRPDLLHLPTTNGEHCTGDGIKMGEAIGAKTIDLEWVQVHPTGLVKPDDADAKIKFLAAEALRGVGGLILNKEGERFANELGRRDYVTGEMWKNKAPFRLVLNKAASDEIHWHCKHYTGRGVMKYYASGEELAKDMNVPLSVIEKSHQNHYEAAKKTEKDPDGGSWPAYPSGKSWDEASGKTGSGKKFYHNIIPGSAVKTEPFYVAIITPVIHYCMGGLEINAEGGVLGKSGAAIKGLYCAGEVAGGVHGNNRLGGNSLLDCVVFGRVTGVAATKYILGNDVKKVDLKTLTGGGLSGAVQSSKFSGGSYEDNMNESKVVAAKAPAKKEKEKKEKKEKKSSGGGGLTMDEVAKHTSKADCWVVVNGEVLDVTKFLSEHPGGELAILTFGGKDATEEFNMIHPPDVIPKYAPYAPIGNLGAGGTAADDDDDEDDDDEEEEEAGGEGGGYTIEEVAKHTSKTDCWVVVSGQVLDVTKFLGEHPGGELAILTFGGKDATEEFNMIHPPDVIPKYAPYAPIGALGAAKAPKAKKAKTAKKGGAAATGPPPPAVDKGDLIPNLAAWGHYDGAENWRHQGYDHNPGVFLFNVKAYFHAFWSLWLAILYEVCATIFTAKNIKLTSDRVGLTRSAILLVLFMVIHGVGNLHVFMGPDDFNGYGYFYVRLYWTGFGLPANIVEEYILLSAMLHMFVGVRRSWDKRSLAKSSGLFPTMNLALSGVMLGTFMTIHLFQFRFGDTMQYYIRPPPMLISAYGLPHLNLFWTTDKAVTPVPVRDIYNLEYKLFNGMNNFWAYFYIFSVCVFMTHACLGWQKVTPVLGVPKKHIPKVEKYGYAIFFVLGAIYISFPLYCMMTEPYAGHEASLQPSNPLLIPGA